MSDETTEKTELEKLWQDYLQKCCEVGQIEFQLHQLDSQKTQIEKNLEETKRKVRSVAQKHRELQGEVLKIMKPVDDKPEMGVVQ